MIASLSLYMSKSAAKPNSLSSTKSARANIQLVSKVDKCRTQPDNWMGRGLKYQEFQEYHYPEDKEVKKLLFVWDIATLGQ